MMKLMEKDSASLVFYVLTADTLQRCADEGGTSARAAATAACVFLTSAFCIIEPTRVIRLYL